MNLLAFALAYSGLAGLCLAMERHHRTALGRTPNRRTAALMRVAGCALLTASIVPTVAAQPGATGYVAWFGLVTAAGLLLIFVLPYAPRMAARLAIGAPVAAGLAVLLRAVS